MNNYNRATQLISELDGKAFWQHLAIYAVVYALLAIADAIRDLKHE